MLAGVGAGSRPVATAALMGRIRHVARPWARALLAVLAGLLFWSLAPAAFGWKSAVVLTGSMEPAIRPGDIAVSDPDPRHDLATGNVVVVEAPGRPGHTVVHRVLEIEANGALILRGDANSTNDSTPIREDDVLGVVRLRIGWVGLPVVWWHQGQRHLVAATGVVLLLLLTAANPPRSRPSDGEDDEASATEDDTDDRPASDVQEQPEPVPA